MKQTVAAGCILLLLVGLSLFSAITVDQTVSETQGLLRQAVTMQNHGDTTQARAILHRASDYWQSRQSCLEILLRHDDVETVTVEFARLRSYAVTVDEDDFLSNCNGLLATLQHIRDMEWPRLNNIL